MEASTPTAYHSSPPQPGGDYWLLNWSGAQVPTTAGGIQTSAEAVLFCTGTEDLQTSEKNWESSHFQEWQKVHGAEEYDSPQSGGLQ